MTTRERQDKFQVLVEAHKGILFKVCNAYCRGRDDREDLAQDIIVQLWRSFERFDERCRFSTWMYRIGLNVAISFHRRERTRARYIVSADVQLLDVTEEPDRDSEDIERLYEAIGALDPLNKALMVLYLDGNSHRDIADVLGISESNVGTKLNRLRTRMRQRLSEPESA